jgi:hypothetical protein
MKDPMASKEGFELDLQIEELEAKLAPGETVLPLGGGHGGGHK